MFINTGGWMLFVDGENLTCRAQELLGSTLRESGPWVKDAYVWLPDRTAYHPFVFPDYPIVTDGYALRSFYYTSIQGDSQKEAKITEALHAIGFQPNVFKGIWRAAAEGCRYRAGD